MFRISRIIFLFFLVFSQGSALLAQRNYYFHARTGSRSTGSRLDPFSSLDTLSWLKLEPGDTVFFHAGEKFRGNPVMENIHGLATKPIVFTSYGKGRSMLDGRDAAAFVIRASSFFNIENISFTGRGRKSGNTNDGLKLLEDDHFRLGQLEISGFQKSGLFLYNCQDAEVDEVFAHDNGQAGISLDGTYQQRISQRIHFIHCRTNNNPGDPTKLDNHSGNGLVVGNCRRVLIEYCTATNNGWDMPRVGNGPVGIWAWEADSVIIQHCISYRNKTARGAADGGGFDLDGGVTNSVIQFCLSYENWGTGYGIYQYYGAGKWFNNTLRYCISINDGNITDQATAMHIWNGWNGDSTFSDCYVYNNLFYSDAKYALSYNPLSAHRRFSFFNNIFIASDTTDILNGTDSSGSDIFLGNLWMKKSGGFRQQGYSSLEKWAASRGYEQYRGKFTGIGSDLPLFELKAPWEIREPSRLAGNSGLLGICLEKLKGRGLDLRKLFGIEGAVTDFFGHPLPKQGGISPGPCQPQ